MTIFETDTPKPCGDEIVENHFTAGMSELCPSHPGAGTGFGSYPPLRR